MVYIKWLNELSKDDGNIVGGKAANLGEMTKIGIPVPQGFAITIDGYWRFVEYNGIGNKIEEILKSIDVNNIAQLRKASNQIQELFMKGNIPDDLKNEILENYRKLSSMFGNEPVFVAVRSSSTTEDLPNASFAGQQATYLNVKGEDKLLDTVKKCWASLWTARVINYRAMLGIDQNKIALSVVVQKQIFSKKSGVMFTADPVKNDLSKIVIECLGDWEKQLFLEQ
jgi:Phosphoenolpyruvate synthase/pyruvate phosphate dikinase